MELFYLCLQDVDLKACQEALDECCPHQGDGQLGLQKEEDINQVNDEKNGRREKCEEEVREDLCLVTESSERNRVHGFERSV